MGKLKKLRKQLLKALKAVDDILENFDDNIIKEDKLKSFFDIKGHKKKKKKN